VTPDRNDLISFFIADAGYKYLLYLPLIQLNARSLSENHARMRTIPEGLIVCISARHFFGSPFPRLLK
jgi:hypothetical protein